MKVEPTELPGVVLIVPKVFADQRGVFWETWHKPRYLEHGISVEQQDNVSWSRKNVLRGLHYQLPNPQSKLVYVLYGVVWDVAVDIRPDSPTYRRWVGVELSRENHRQLYIPAGFAHGFCVLSEEAVLAYKCGDIYRGEYDRAVRWDDPDLNIPWPVKDPILSSKDAAAPRLSAVAANHLPRLSDSQSAVNE